MTIALELKLYELYNEEFNIIDGCTFAAKTVSPPIGGRSLVPTDVLNVVGAIDLLSTCGDQPISFKSLIGLPLCSVWRKSDIGVGILHVIQAPRPWSAINQSVAMLCI
ncbi:uncharacterized protein MYCFIDRAFT_172602 [Pseudocercospora fijiensis CIRAD86]|uniref:Uncharacterized protein n=1 Tax=Pseudocercospora fijiensis (strain CIRAD86) TaxID=383855 RepID=M3A744_PSEFD|nr:uncharacterized protein MYCFIDRAFT_172602 [Pseudocercospora fijiensis CIRAD86]EME86909.1 hypothetical protein MYCFIDRAFT_172602 [Pseudocercospora fijiensis CIRAD86]